MIHRAPFGSMERFIAVLIENCAGEFPLWLSPEQLIILPISEKFAAYAEEVKNLLEVEDIMAQVDNRDEKIGRKIRDAEVRKLPYMLIVGEKEVENNMVSVRKHGSGDLGSLSISDFLAEFKKSVAESLSQQA
jgi:threonyl-tRNA synthetase